MNRQFKYSGDVNIECGGYFYSLTTWKWGYCDVVRVTPCSDAGGPDNLFWVETLTVNLREGVALASIIATAGGWKPDDIQSESARRAMILDAHVGYGAYDIDRSEIVQIGKPDTFYDGIETFNVDKVLRAGTNLYRYARKQCKGL